MAFLSSGKSPFISTGISLRSHLVNLGTITATRPIPARKDTIDLSREAFRARTIPQTRDYGLKFRILKSIVRCTTKIRSSYRKANRAIDIPGANLRLSLYAGLGFTCMYLMIRLPTTAIGSFYDNKSFNSAELLQNSLLLYAGSAALALAANSKHLRKISNNLSSIGFIYCTVGMVLSALPMLMPAIIIEDKCKQIKSRILRAHKPKPLAVPSARSVLSDNFSV